MSEEIITTLQRECETLHAIVKTQLLTIDELTRHRDMLADEVKRLDSELVRAYDELAQARYEG